MIDSELCLASRLTGVNFLEPVEQLLLLFLSSDNSLDKFSMISEGGPEASCTYLVSLMCEK